MSTELIDLLKEVERLREHTDALVCRCNQSNCPFNHSNKTSGSLTSLNSLNFSQSSEEDDRLILRRQWSPPIISVGESVRMHSKSTGNLTYVVPGVQRRADGTIVEGDGPRYAIGEGAKPMRRCGTYNGFTQANYLDIGNCVIRETEDCAVDYENTFSTEGYEFSRKAPERRQFRSPKIQKRGHSKLKSSASYPVEGAIQQQNISSPATSHKSVGGVIEEGSCRQRGRSSSSPTVVSASRHISLDQSAGTQKWSSKTFERASQQA